MLIISDRSTGFWLYARRAELRSQCGTSPRCFKQTFGRLPRAKRWALPAPPDGRTTAIAGIFHFLEFSAIMNL